MARRRASFAGLTVLGFLLCIAMPSFAEIRIGVVLDGPEDVRLFTDFAVFEREILEFVGNEFGVRFPESKRLVGDWTPGSVSRALSALLEDSDVDLILALGLLASSEVASRGPLQTPVIAPLVIDRRWQRLPFKDGATGVKNLVYLTSTAPLKRDLEMLVSLTSAKKIAILANPTLLEAFPGLAEGASAMLRDLGLDFELVPIASTENSVQVTVPPSKILESISEDVEAVYLGPATHLSSAEFRELVGGLIARKLPTFALRGKSDVVRGILAGLTPEEDRTRLARTVALYVRRILSGEDPGTFPVHFERHERLTINMRTARAIGYFPSWGVLADAELLHVEPDRADRVISLASAMKEAVERNLELAARTKSVQGSRYSIAEARASLLLQSEVSALGVVIDKDRAASSLGAAPRYLLTGSLTFQQLLYSEPALANLFIQKRLQEGRVHEREVLYVDIALEAAVTYLNLLRAKTAERIERNNLEVTRSHLEVARVRHNIGVSGLADVYRWESKMASDRQRVIDARALRRLAELALNRLLHHPLEEPFATAEIGLGDTEVMERNARFAEHLNDERSSEIFRDFAVMTGLEDAAELKFFEAAIRAQERRFVSTKRSYWAPTLVVQAEISREIADAGVGSGGGGGDFSGLSDVLGADIEFPQSNDTDWNIALRGSFPLATGGRRRAERLRAKHTLEGLRLEYQSASEQVEQRIRSALISARASFAGIEQAGLSAEAATKNFELVEDSYSRGVVPIIDLLDAQSSDRVAQQVAANALYDFFIDLMEAQRSMNNFILFRAPSERQAWFQRLEEYTKQRRAE